MEEELAARVARQFPALYLTLVSVLVGLVLADLFSTVHARVTLWPLTLETGRTWCQILGTVLAVLSSWVAYSHLGLLRNRLDAALVLVTIPLNAEVGLHDGTAWFFWAGAFSLLGLLAIRINLWQGAREPRLRHLPRLGRFGGPFTMLWVGAPGYFAVAVACHYHLTTPLFELAAVATSGAGAIWVTIRFMREWREAVLLASATSPQAPLACRDAVV